MDENMTKLSESRQKGLEIARQVFQYAGANLLYMQARRNIIRAFSFYDGDGQYPEAFLRDWRNKYGDCELDYGLAPPLINKVKPIINNVSGVEIQARFRTAYRSHTDNESDEKLAKALTHYSYYIQEHNNIPLIQSNKFRDMLICGAGWSNIYLQNNRIYCDYTHPLNILYDADDFSPLMTDQHYVCRMHWLTKETMLLLWHQYKKEIDELFYNANPLGIGSYSPEFFNRINEMVDLYAIGGGDGIGSRILVIEVQRREARKYFSGIDEEGRYFQTFDEELAHDMLGERESLNEEQGYQIIRTVFCNNVVFEHGPLNPNLPNGNFTYVPGVYSRRSSDGVVDGWLSSMEGIQKIINYTKAKELTLQNSVRAIVDTGALVEGQTPEELQQILARHDSIIYKNKDANISLHPNVDLAATQINTAKRLDEELQQVSGMYGDSFGAPTNATAAVSINSRVKNSFRTQVVGFDNLMFMKKREATVILDMIQGSGIENLAISILDDDEKEEVYLNIVESKNGKVKIHNNIRNIPMSIYIEQTHDYESSPQEQRETLQALLSNPNAMTILQSPQLLKLMGNRHWKKISDEMQMINQQKFQNENMIQNDMNPLEQPLEGVGMMAQAHGMLK